MDKFEKQRRIFTIVAILVLLSVLSLIVVISRMLQEVSSGELPKVAAIATLVGMGVHLLVLIGILVGISLTKRRRRINREINLVTAIVLTFLGFIVADGAVSYINDQLFISIGMFLCVFCDFAAIVVSVAALFLLKQKKEKQPG
jgi:hypothetical protein